MQIKPTLNVRGTLMVSRNVRQSVLFNTIFILNVLSESGVI